MKDKLNYIDSIRGVAILMVILVHTAQSVKSESPLIQQLAEYGKMGVQLFFIASAYTLCHSWLKRADETNKVIHFAIRRFFRIAPLYYFGLAMYFSVSIVENYYRSGIIEPAPQYSLINIVVNLLFLNGFYPPANNNIVPGGWSIGTEAGFYALLPLFMLLLNGKTRSQGCASMKIPVLALLISQVTLLLLWTLTGETVNNNSFIYFNIINQLPVFLMGMSFYFVSSQGAWPVRSAFANLLYFLFFTFLSILFLRLSSSSWFSPTPFVSGISFLFLVKAFELTPAANHKILQNIGKASYSMYIFHFLFAHKAASIINQKLQTEEIIGGNGTLATYYVLSVLLTFATAKISERIIEHRFIKFGSAIINNRATRSPKGLVETRQ